MLTVVKTVVFSDGNMQEIAIASTGKQISSLTHSTRRSTIVARRNPRVTQRATIVAAVT